MTHPDCRQQTFVEQPPALHLLQLKEHKLNPVAAKKPTATLRKTWSRKLVLLDVAAEQ